MKLIVVCLFVLLLGCTKKKEYIHWRHSIIKHTPKEVKYFSFTPIIDENGIIKRGDLLNKPGTVEGMGYWLTFNNEGKKTSRYDYGRGGLKISQYMEWEYISKEEIKFSLFMSRPDYKRCTDFDIELYNADNKVVNKKDFIPASLSFSEKDQLSTETVYNYNSYGDLIEEKYYIYDSREPYAIEDSTITTIDTEYKNGKLHKHGYFKYLYYEDGRKKVLHEPSGSYDEFYPSKIIKMHYDLETQYFEYDEDGYVIKVVRDNMVYNIEYDNLDKYGNWTRLIAYANKKPIVYGERTLKYYD